MRIRIVQKPSVAFIDGVRLDQFRLGNVYHLGSLLAGVFLAEGWAEPVDDPTPAELDPTRQLIGAQCSGTLLLSRLGLLRDMPACTDLTTKPWVIEAGTAVLDQPFYAKGNIATAGGCLASQYLAAWVLLSAGLLGDAEAVLHYVAPVGQKEEYVARAIETVRAYCVPAEAALT